MMLNTEARDISDNGEKSDFNGVVSIQDKCGHFEIGVAQGFEYCTCTITKEQLLKMISDVQDFLNVES